MGSPSIFSFRKTREKEEKDEDQENETSMEELWISRAGIPRNTFLYIQFFLPFGKDLLRKSKNTRKRLTENTEDLGATLPFFQ